ncbi:MAG: DUF3494 domain-containing protein [Thermoplasmata archaeon]|nr:DUF3494 domain-containing protein [Thermoplasmata archaeon]
MNRKLIAPMIAVVAIAVLMLSTLVAASPGSSSRGTASSSTRDSAQAGSSVVSTGVTAGPCGQAKVPLGAAGNFRVLAGTTVTNTGATVINGNLGVSPGSAVTGFPPGKVTGKIHKADTAAAHAQKDLVKAYNNAMGRTNCAKSIAGNIGGRTLGPGLYRSGSSLSISSGDLTLSAHGHSGAVFIFQIVTKFTTTSGRHVILAGGALASNIYWAVGSSATLGTTSVVYGDILAHKSISFATGAKLHGRALAHIGAVTLAGGKVSHIANSPAPLPSLGRSSTVARPFP